MIFLWIGNSQASNIMALWLGITILQLQPGCSETWTSKVRELRSKTKKLNQPKKMGISGQVKKKDDFWPKPPEVLPPKPGSRESESSQPGEIRVKRWWFAMDPIKHGENGLVTHVYIILKMTKIIQNQWFFSDWCPNGGIKPTASWAGFWSSHIPLRIPKVNSGVTSSRNQLQFHGPESWNIATHTCAGTGIVLVKVLAWLLQIMHWRLCNCGYQTRGPEKSWSLPQNPLPASKTLQYPKKEVYIMCIYIYQTEN